MTKTTNARKIWVSKLVVTQSGKAIVMASDIYFVQ